MNSTPLAGVDEDNRRRRIRLARTPGVASTGDSFNSDEWGFNHLSRNVPTPATLSSVPPSSNGAPTTVTDLPNEPRVGGFS